jgi:hypothetical protein
VSSFLGPPYPVTLNPKGEAVVVMPLPWAETLREKLRAYDLACDLSAAPTPAGSDATATLNFGTGADVPRIQRIIDSFTIPPLPVVMGS